MVIEDPLLYQFFLDDYPIGSTMDTLHGFDIRTDIGKKFNEVYRDLYPTIGDQNATTQATAFVMSYFNTGLVMYKKEKNGTKFKKVNTSVTKDAAGNNIYSNYPCP